MVTYHIDCTCLWRVGTNNECDGLFSRCVYFVLGFCWGIDSRCVENSMVMVNRKQSRGEG